MIYWFDTEFIERPCTIDLISIGIVAEDGREYYAVSSEFDVAQANPWVQENVLPQLPPPAERRSRAAIAAEVEAFIAAGTGRPEFWGYYADYDWVVLCWLFGPMIDLPNGWPMYCRDLKQWADRLDNARLPPKPVGEHHALTDARWNRRAWGFLQRLEADRARL